MNKRTPEYAMRAMQKYEESMRALLAEYRENIISVPAELRWNFAIPENYTNYHDGFIVQDELPSAALTARIAQSCSRAATGLLLKYLYMAPPQPEINHRRGFQKSIRYRT